MATYDQLTSLDVAQRLGISQRTVARWVDAGRLTPAQKFPGETGGYLFERSEVERLAAQLRDGRDAA